MLPDARVAIISRLFNNFINDSLLEGAIDAHGNVSSQSKDETLPLFGYSAYEYNWRLGTPIRLGKYDIDCRFLVHYLIIRGGTARFEYVALVVQTTFRRMLPGTMKFQLLSNYNARSIEQAI